MSQGQPWSPQAGGQDQPMRQDRPLRYGDVFNVSAYPATRTGSTRRCRSLRKSPYSDRPKRVVQLLPCNLLHRNEQAGFVSHWLASDAAAYQGVTVTKTGIPGTLLIPISGLKTIGEALEATSQIEGNKPVLDQSNAAAIHAAEVRATGITVIIPGGLAASPAQSAAVF